MGRWRQLAVDVPGDEAEGGVVEDEGAWQLQAQAAADAVGQLHRRQAVKAARTDLTPCSTAMWFDKMNKNSLSKKTPAWTCTSSQTMPGLKNT